MNIRSQTKGFTLVELAIVITIIGLLIGGVLKGQEVLENARAVSQATQVRHFQTALVTFQSVYKALPGDIRRPGQYLKDCTTSPCNVGGNGDGYISDTGILSAENEWTPCHGNTKEGRLFWLHLATAGLITGIDTAGTWTGSGTSCGTWGVEAPRAAINDIGGFHVASYRVSTANLKFNGVYLVLQSNAADAWTSSETLLHPSVAQKFDAKADDGMPLTGNIWTFSTNGCANSTTKGYNIEYNPPAPQFQGCNLMISAMP